MTTPGGYSAGTIFLQVIPSYRDFMKSLKGDAKQIEKALKGELTKAMEQGDPVPSPLATPAAKKANKKAAKEQGEEAADEYAGAFRSNLRRSLAKSQRELKPLQGRVFSPAQQKEVDDLLGKLGRLKAAADDVNVDLDSNVIARQVQQIQKRLERLRDTSADVGERMDFQAAVDGVRDLNKGFDDLRDSHRAAHREKMNALQAEAAAINRNYDLERKGAAARRARREGKSMTDARSAAAQAASGISQDAGGLAGQARDRLRAVAELDLDSGSFYAELRIAARELDRVARDRTVDINVRTDARNAAGQIRGALGEADGKRTAGGVGDAASNLRAFNARILAAVSIGPLLIPVLAGLAAGATALGAAFAGAGVGLGAMILGFSGISDAVGAINDVQQNGAKEAKAYDKAVRSAARGVRDAQQALDRARQQAGRTAEDAAERVQRAVENQADAEQDLLSAQRDALRAQERLTRARADAEDQLEDMALRARGGALAERQALIDLFEAEVAYRNAMADGGATNKEREQASINLERERLNIEQVRLENGRMAEEQAEVARTGVEGLESVAAAREAVVEADERVLDAQQNVADAARDVVRAQVDGAQAVADSQQAIADAQQRLADAQADYNDALTQTSASADKLNEAMSKLGPAGQAFAIFIAGLKDEFFALRDAVQAGMLPGVQRAIEALLPYLPQFTAFMGEMGKTIGDLFEKFALFLTTSPAMQAFFSMMGTYAPIFTTLFGEILFAMIELFSVLATAFAPFAADMLAGLRDMLLGWSAFLQTEEGQKMMQDFMDYVREVGPQVLDFLGALFSALLNLGEALAPYAGMLLRGLTDFFEFIAGMDPALLGPLVLGFLGLVFAFQALAGLVGAIASVFGLIMTLVRFVGLTGVAAMLGWALAIAAVIAILVVAYYKFDWFRAIVDAVFKAIWAVVKWAFDGIMWVWENVLYPVLKAIIAWVRFVFDVWATVFGIIGALFGLALEVIKALWTAFTETGAGKAIIGFFDEKVKPAWLAFITFVGWLWDQIVDKFKGGVSLVVRFINEGIVDNINALATKLGVDNKVDRLADPFANTGGASTRGGRQEFATGGHVGGWSPSPTADNIPAMLTAGEYVLPVKAVKALRAKFGDQFLEHLRGGLPGFAQGGLVEFGRMLQLRGYRVAEHPSFGGVRGRHSTNSLHYSGNAIDVNWAAGTSPAEQRALAAIVPLAKDYGLRSIFMAPGHYGHAHFDTGRSGSILGRLANLAGGAFSAVGGGASWLKDKAGDALSPLKWMVNKALDFSGISALRDTTLGKSVLESGMGLLRGGIGWIKDQAGDSLGDFFSSNGGPDDPNLKLYDSGGWLPPGLTTVLNASGRPEPVLTADQWDMIEAGSGLGGGGDTYNVPVTQQNDPNAVADAIRFSQRHARRGGVYAGRG